MPRSDDWMDLPPLQPPAMTITQAKQPQPIEDAEPARAVIVRMDTVQPRAIEWLWADRIPMGKLTLIVGNPGVAKSFLTMDIAARVSSGSGWPDEREQREPADVMLVAVEDAIDDTVAPRLLAAGADMSRIHSLQGVAFREETRAFTLRDLYTIEAALHDLPDVKLLVIDPLTAIMDGIDSHKNAEVRSAIRPLADLAERTGIAVVCVSHTRKSEGAAIHATLGSVGYVAAARAVWAVTKDRMIRAAVCSCQ